MAEKVYLDKTVYDATQERLAYIFSEFEQVLVAFSGGKDSGVLLNLAYRYAAENKTLDKLSFYHMDYEADYDESDAFVKRCFEDNYDDIKRKYWLCLPISAQCSVSVFRDYWIPWDSKDKSIWVKDMPQSSSVIHEGNVPFAFEKGNYGADTRIQFARWFADKYGKTAVLVGIRCGESLSRQAILTSQHRAHMYQNTRYSKKIDSGLYSFYPIYDWETEDIWTANARFGWDYNKVYDLFHMAGVSIHQMRTASPFHSCGQSSLKLFKALAPHQWGRMVSRVNGVNFTGIYGGTDALGWGNITKPPHLTWKQYAEFLIDTLPEKVKRRVLKNLDRVTQNWENEGYGRNPTVIRTMEKEGAVLEHTGADDKRCTKPGFYEIVKLKNGFLDETSVPLFRKVPSWKGVCVAILKNDTTFQSLGFARTKKDMEKRKEAIEKWSNLL